MATIPPLVLLHGFTGGPESWRSVLHQLNLPPGDGVVMTPFLAGHGEDPGSLGLDPTTHSFDAELERLAELYREQRLTARPPGLLVGYSLGARIGLGLLLRYPEFFQGAVLVGVNPGLTGQDARAKRLAEDERLAQLAESAGLEGLLEHWERLPLFSSQRQLPSTTLVEQASVRRRNTAVGLALSLRTCGLAQMPDYWPHLAALKHPIRLVVGQYDQRFVEIAQHMSEMLPQASIDLIPGCGHNIPLEAPAALAALIQAALIKADP